MSAPAALSLAAGELQTLLADQPTMPLKPHQVRAYEDEANRLRGIAEGRDMEGNPVPWIGGNRGDAAKEFRRIQGVLERDAPKKLAGDLANRVHRLVRRVIDEQVKPALLPKSVMWRNPAGAVGAFQRQENSSAVKETILTVRRALRALDPMNEDPDFCNMERFRPSGEGPNGAATFSSDATIPGNFAMTPQAKANWPLGEATVDTPLKQVQRRESATALKPATPRKPPTANQLAALARARAARRATKETVARTAKA